MHGLLQVTANRLDDSPIRHARFQGRQHLVLPAVMLREQVLSCMNCEAGGEYVPAAELAASTAGWAGRPVTLGHPMDGDVPISANAPDVLERTQVGWVFNPTFDNGALKGEAWIDIAAARKVVGGARLLERLEAGQMLEVSTGYFRDAERKKGTFNGASYVLVQRNIVPDHFAILLDEPGACSVQDGCGAPRVNADGESLSARVRAVDDAVWARNQDLGDGRQEDWWFAVETFEDAVIVRQGAALFQVPYTLEDDGSVSFGEPVEVEVQYRPLRDNMTTRIAKRLARLLRLPGQTTHDMPDPGDTTGGGPTANTVHPQRESTMDRSKTIAALAANEAVPFTAEQLEAMTDEQLAGLETLATPPATTGDDAGQPAANKGDCGCKDQPKANQPANPQPADAQAVANAVREALGFDPAEVREFMAAEKQRREGEKAALVGRLAANEACPLDKAELEAMSLAALQKLERSYTPASYLGLGGPRGVANADEDTPPAPPAVLLAGNTDTNGKEG